MSFDDLELLAWYPSLTTRDEKKVHRVCSTSYGEFHSVKDLEPAMAYCRKLGGVCTMPSNDDLLLAKSWGNKKT